MIKNFISILLLFLTGLAFCQDTIIKKDSELIVTKILEIKSKEVSYKKFDNVNGPSYILEKSEISEIRFQNGIRETFDTVEKDRKEKSLEETKEFLVRTINEYCFEQDSDTRKYRANFEGDYLRLIVMNKKGTKQVNDGLQWDFSKVYKFQKVSKKENNIAFINVWMEFISNEKKDTHKKNKLVIQVKGHDVADQIMLGLRHLNKLLLTKQSKFEKFN